MNDSVTRYSGGSHILEDHETGGFVKYSDYQALKSKLQEAELKMEATRKVIAAEHNPGLAGRISDAIQTALSALPDSPVDRNLSTSINSENIDKSPAGDGENEVRGKGITKRVERLHNQRDIAVDEGEKNVEGLVSVLKQLQDCEGLTRHAEKIIENAIAKYKATNVLKEWEDG